MSEQRGERFDRASFDILDARSELQRACSARCAHKFNQKVKIFSSMYESGATHTYLSFTARSGAALKSLFKH